MGELLTVAGLIKVLKVLVVDLFLAGDNAILISMVAGHLEHDLRKKAIFFGTFGAIVLRLVLAFLFVEALHTIPYLHLIGGILLLWIAIELMIQDKHKHKKHIGAKKKLLSAICTIIIADGVMSIDNVLGVVAAAEGHMVLVMAGILVSVPIIVWGSNLFSDLIEKYPWILYLGGAILAWSAVGMIIQDSSVSAVLGDQHLTLGSAAMVLCYIISKIISRMKLAGHVKRAKERHAQKRSERKTGKKENL